MFGLNDSRQVVNLLVMTSRQLKTMLNKKLAEMNLTFPQLLVLGTLKENEKSGGSSLSPAAIAEALEYDRPTVTGIIDRLEKHGNVTRLVCPHDRRSQSIALTDTARTLLETIDNFSNHNERLSLRGFSKEEVLLFESMLMRVNSNLNEESN